MDTGEVSELGESIIREISKVIIGKKNVLELF